MTSNLLKHLSTSHPGAVHKSKAAVEEPRPKRGPLDVFVKQMDCPAGRAGQLTEAIVGMAALDLRPIRTVDGIGFRRLMGIVEAGYRVPSRTFVASLLRKKHQEGVDKLKTMLASATGVSITTHMWTGRWKPT